LDRPFTYDLASELGAGVGSLVRFRFHGSLTKGWILGPTDDVPPRMLPVQRVVSAVPAFDEELLALARWVAARYVAPLATVLDRLSPPRVASEEDAVPAAADGAVGSTPPPASPVFTAYREGQALLATLRSGSGGFTVRPAPDDEGAAAAEAVAACLAGGRRAIVLVPEATPAPATVTLLRERFGPRVAVFAGGDRRTRYRTWLAIRDGAADVIVGTRPAVYAPVKDLGLIWVARESHPGHREERSPMTHVRDVGMARARGVGAVLVLASLCPSAESAAMDLRHVAPVSRRWPKVEVVPPGPEGRARRLVQALPEVRRGFLFTPLRGYGTAAVCRSCRAPAACASCGGVLRLADGAIRCAVCETPGRCRVCGGGSFAIRRGGAERVVEWARAVAGVPVREPGRPRLPRAREILVGGAGDVRDLGPAGLDLVGVLDADLGLRRPGLAGRERALATWMEAVAWAAPAGRVIVQAEASSDPAIQALVRGDAARFHERERTVRAAAGFPVGSAVFRAVGDDRLPAVVAAIPAITSLVTTLEGRTVCLLALEPGQIDAFGAAMRTLAAAGGLERVDAEPHL